MRAYIGLGANVGNARTTLEAAVKGLGALPGVRVAGVSALYRTTPVGVSDQPDFLNAVAALDVPAGADPESGAMALLLTLKQLETALGRRPRQRWGPRELDLDLLLFGPHEIDVARADGRWLHVPHPQLAERLFVLAPLAEIAPTLRPPRWTETVAEAAERRRLAEGENAARRLARWRSPAGWSDDA